MKRRKNGRFARGNRGGPGRPKKPPPAAPIVDPLDIELQAMLERDAEQAWQTLIDRWPPTKLLDLATEAVARGQVLPPNVLALLQQAINRTRPARRPRK